MNKIGLMNGPNLNRLGKREPIIYGSLTLKEIEKKVLALSKSFSCEIHCFQSNHEGRLIDKIHEWSDSEFHGLILNPGGLSHTSVALRDAVASSVMKTVEVHISNIHAREVFRHTSLISGAVSAVIAGLGYHGYLAALHYLSQEN